MLDDGEAQPRAALLAAAVLVHAVEPLEDAVAMLRRDADAVVLDGEDRLSAARREREDDVGRAAVAQGVLHEIGEGVLHEPRVARDGDGGQVAADETDVRGVSLRPEAHLDAAGDVRQVGGGEGGGLVALLLLEVRQLEDVLREGVEADALAAQQAEERLAAVGRQVVAAVEEVDRAEDAGEGGLDLVGEVGDELAPEALGPPKLGELPLAFADARAELVGEEEDEEEAGGADEPGEDEPEAGAVEGGVEARERDGEAHDVLARALGAEEHLFAGRLRAADRGADAVDAGGLNLRAAPMPAEGGGVGVVHDAARGGEDGEARAIFAAAVSELANAAEVACLDGLAEGVGGEQGTRAHVALRPAADRGAEGAELGGEHPDACGEAAGGEDAGKGVSDANCHAATIVAHSGGPFVV